MITVDSKKEFIQKFLNRYQLKRRESVWILNYITNHVKLLNHVHFVKEGVEHCPKGFSISAHCSKERPFHYYNGSTIISDPEKSFHHMRMNQDEDYYIQLNFKDSDTFIEYLNIVENNPYSLDLQEKRIEDSKLADKFWEHCLLQSRKDEIKRLIDVALDEDDRDKFYELSSELISIK